MSNKKKEYIVTWFIENYNHCWHGNGEKLITPDFSVDGFEGTYWNLQVYPRGHRERDKGKISFYLYRSNNDDGPESFSVKYEPSVLAEDGSIIHSRNMIEHTFKSKTGYGWFHFLDREDVLLRRKERYLPKDTFRLRCKMWNEEGNTQSVTHICIRTRIGIENLSFLHEMENFNTLESNEEKAIQIKSPLKNAYCLSSSLHFSDGSCCDGNIMIDIALSGTNQILSKCNVYLLDVSGTLTKCGEADNRLDVTKNDIKKIKLFVKRQTILKKRDEYLPNDKLSLFYDCILSTGVEYEKIEKTQFEIPFAVLDQITHVDQNDYIYNTAEKLSTCSNVLKDFKSIYNNQLFSDVKLKTKIKLIPTHKVVLGARSPVFKAMLTNDMKEKHTNCIEVEDLDDDTVEQLLLFLYTDSLENLQWESTIKLYYAADKYAIENLKILCSSYLIDNLSTPTASELLLLADTHNDSDLKKAVEGFIFKHEEEVFGSDEWGNLMETNPLLVSKTMRLKYIRKL